MESTATAIAPAIPPTIDQPATTRKETANDTARKAVRKTAIGMTGPDPLKAEGSADARQHGSTAPLMPRPAHQVAREMSRATSHPARLGRLGEEYVAAILVAHGWEIVGRNYRTRYGEIDIAAHAPGGILAIVEVKTRASLRTGLPEQAVTSAKQHKLRLAASAWLADHPHHGGSARFDVASLIVRGGRILLDYREGAF